VGWMKKLADTGRRTIDEAREAGKDGPTVAKRVRNAAQAASAALQQDRAQAQANAISEAQRAARRLAAKHGQVLEMALAYCGPAVPPPRTPHEEPTRVLATLTSSLRRQADAWDHGA